MKRLRFYVNRAKPGVAEVANELAQQACALGFSVAPEASPECVVSLGGDGTFLRAVHEFPSVPVLGLNLGGLGYLASVERRDFARALNLLAAGSYRISERVLLEVNGRYRAFNDVVIVRELSGHSACLDLEADGHPVTQYMADGLIFSTPTGSTAYSLAAGGPVVMPDSANFVVTPMNPHALGVRPIVLRDSVRFVVTAHLRTAGNTMKVAVYADGENVLTLDAGESVSIAKSPSVARVVELEGYDPYLVMARKLGWRGSNV